MTRKANFSLDQAILDPGFTPSQKDVEPLLDRLATCAEELEPLVLRSLVRLGNKAFGALLSRAQETADPRVMRRLIRLLGQLLRAEPSPGAFAYLLSQLGHADPKVRSIAANALGKLKDPALEQALIDALSSEGVESVQRAIVQALGYVGGEKALAAIERVKLGDAVSEQRKSRASMMVARELERERASSFEAGRKAFAPLSIALRCRAGMEDFLCDELASGFEAKVCRDLPLGLRVELKLKGAPLELFQARLFSSLAFLLPPRKISSPDELPDAVIDILSSENAFQILKHWTQGPLRYRLAWAKGGKRRSAVFRVASEVSKRRPELHNDPRESPWQALVHEAPNAVHIELVPRLNDTRFAYRAGDVPASSHPTIAALIAHVSGVRDDDIVWDPFVGSGLELCERSLRGPYRMLLGSDLNPAALEIARTNLQNAKALHFKLFQHDILDPLPAFEARPTLVVSNPPMGLRIHRSSALPVVLDAFIARAALALCPGGRLVWISPMPERTALQAKEAGLSLVLHKFIDMGGFEAQLQAFSKAGARETRKFKR